MGYYTSYSLSKISGCEESYDAFVQEIKELSGIDFSEGGCNEKWYEWENHMKEASKNHPEIIVQLDGAGEEETDLWAARFQNGEEEYVEMSMPNFIHVVPQYIKKNIGIVLNNLQISEATHNYTESVLSGTNLPESQRRQLEQKLKDFMIDAVAAYR